MHNPGDYAYLWAWEPIHPEEMVRLLSGFAPPWWICGGWALDVFLGRETRRHDDLDVALLRHDQLRLFEYLRDWELYYATPAHTLRPWDGRPLEPPIHGIWARRSPDPNGPWTCEFLLNEERDGEWAFRRNGVVRRMLEEIGDQRKGVPFLRPEIVLLEKSCDRAPKNDADFAAVRPHLSRAASLWLAAALKECHGPHPWIEGLLAENE